MAFFTISFVRESIVQQWLTAELAAGRNAASVPATKAEARAITATVQGGP
jgi:hypothetical protein